MSMSKPIEIRNNRDVLIDSSCLVKVKEMGNQLELSHIKSVPVELPIIKLSDTHYMVKKTGEVKEYNKSKTRDQQIKSLRRTFKNLQELINTNFYGLANEKFITLTYAKHQRDEKEVYKDFQAFIRLVKKRYGKLDYINVVEPQETGSWHCHVLVKFYELPNNYIDYNEFRTYWKHGSFVNVQSLETVHNVGLYLSAYLTDIEVNNDTLTDMAMFEQEVEVIEKEVNGESKRFIKGGRLHYYPTGMRIYRTSRGIKKPTVYYMQKDTVDLESYEFKRSNKIELVQDGSLINHIHYEHYSKK